MTTTDPPPLTVVRPDEGLTGKLGSIGVDFKLWGRDTGGAVSVVEPEQVTTIAEGYGLHFDEPEWLPGVISRYGLTPPR